MGLEIRCVVSWDEAFFQDWCLLHARLKAKTVLAESIADFELLLKNKADFPDEDWRAFSVHQDQKLVARGLVSINRQRPEIAKVGFLEFDDAAAAVDLLWQHVESFARQKGARLLKGPINFHFFVGYRWRTFSKAKPFYGEPQQPSYYLAHFQRLGMRPLKTWETFRIRFFRSKRNYGEIRKAKRPEQRLRIRGIDMNNFEQEMVVIHRLFHEAFSAMPEFERISLEAFKKLYGSFRHIISPLFAFILEDAGNPVAFCINFMDPQALLLQHERLSKILPMKLVRLWTWLRIKLNFSRLLIMYVGRLPAPDGREYQGIQSLVAKKMTLPVALSVPHLLICYTAEDSPALKSYAPDQREVLSGYALFGKDL